MVITVSYKKLSYFYLTTVAKKHAKHSIYNSTNLVVGFTCCKRTSVTFDKLPEWPRARIQIAQEGYIYRYLGTVYLNTTRHLWMYEK